MVMIIRYSDGSYVEGVISRLDGGTLRAAVAGLDDAVEYTLMRDKWISETGLVVTLDFPIEKARDRFPIVPLMTGQPEGCATGGDCVLRRTSGSCAGTVN